MNTVNGTAELVTGIKSVYSTVYYGDDAMLHPELVSSGIVTLKKGNLTLGQVNFNASHGNSDGSFRFAFHRVVVTDAVDLEILVDINGGEVTTNITPFESNRDVFEKTLPEVEEITTRLEL